MERIRRNDFSYCDAMSFAVMERLGIVEVVSFDGHFQPYGQFVAL